MNAKGKFKKSNTLLRRKFIYNVHSFPFGQAPCTLKYLHNFAEGYSLKRKTCNGTEIERTFVVTSFVTRIRPRSCSRRVRWGCRVI